MTSRRAKRSSDRDGERRLDELSTAALDLVMAVVEEVADAPKGASEKLIDIEFPTLDSAKYALRRINEVLAAGEWLDEVEAWIWQADTHVRAPLSAHGETNGWELRLERR